ncbi:MAG: hypothetical protein P4L53_13005 [Candidatus Obscuribacterales bacterium]|nr:hypothetical protein [Candidatus Obscuribacterales bacterium]
MLSAIRLRLTKLVSIFNKQAQTEPVEDPSVDGSPWKQNLRDLAKERLARIGAEPAPVDEIATFVNDLAHAAGDVDPKNLKASRQAMPAINADAEAKSGKSKRIMDGTVQDVKAWYGESVGTWDPVNGAAVDSIEQKRKARAGNHWFN